MNIYLYRKLKEHIYFSFDYSPPPPLPFWQSKNLIQFVEHCIQEHFLKVKEEVDSSSDLHLFQRPFFTPCIPAWDC